MPAATPVPLSVVMRTRGDRQALLADALLCLAAQTEADFEVIVCVHAPEPATAAVAELVDEFAHEFSDRVRVVAVAGDGRARPLNSGCDIARGGHVAFLDDDDVVTAGWVDAFVRAGSHSPASIIRARCYVRPVEPSPRADLPYLITAPPAPMHAARFDTVEHLFTNQTPICSFAVPRVLLDGGMRFDESLPVFEDWEFLLRCALVADVVDVDAVTSIYNFWDRSAGALAEHDEQVWVDTRARIMATLDRERLPMPRGSASRLRDLEAELRESKRELAEITTHARAVEAELERAAGYCRDLERHRDWSADHVRALELHSADQGARIGALESEISAYRRIGADRLLRAVRRLRGSRTP